jgi:hypothetical protein
VLLPQLEAVDDRTVVAAHLVSARPQLDRHVQRGSRAPFTSRLSRRVLNHDQQLGTAPAPRKSTGSSAGS